MTITRQEIRWMLNFVKDSCDTSERLKDWPGQKYAALHQLEYENMSALADKLQAILDNGAKRVTIR